MRFLLIISCFIICSCSTDKKVRVILDTDIAPDYDDVGAMALLHAFADAGEADILAVISCNAFETTAPTISVLNTYFNRPEIPIGIVKDSIPNRDCIQRWAQSINEKYPHDLKSNDEAEEAVTLYRRILAAQPDNSVTIISVGFFTNLSNLLDSSPDPHSPLNGRDLVASKVKRLVSMATGIKPQTGTGHEFNVWVDAAAAKKVFAEWPTPILLSGFEIGEKILTGARLIAKDSIQNSPVKDAYSVALAQDNNTAGRNSWDQTAVLVGVRGWESYYTTRKINFEIREDGTNVLVRGERLEYLVEKTPPAEMARIIEKLMMHQPQSR